MADIIKRQDPIPRIIRPLIDEMHRHTPARAAAVFEQLIDQRPDLAQGDGLGFQILGEETDAAVLEAAGEVPVAEGEAGGDTCGVDDGEGDVDGEGVGDAEDVVAVVEGSGCWVFGHVDCVAHYLHDGEGGFIVPGCHGAEGGDGGKGEEGGGEGGEDGGGRVGGAHGWLLCWEFRMRLVVRDGSQ